MKIVVLAGGTSTEREISIVSGTGICGALRQKGHEAILVDIFCGVENVDWENPFPEEYDVDAASAYMSGFDDKIETMKKERRSFFGENILNSVLENAKDGDLLALYGSSHGIGLYIWMYGTYILVCKEVVLLVGLLSELLLMRIPLRYRSGKNAVTFVSFYYLFCQNAVFRGTFLMEAALVIPLCGVMLREAASPFSDNASIMLYAAFLLLTGAVFVVLIVIHPIMRTLSCFDAWGQRKQIRELFCTEYFLMQPVFRNRLFTVTYHFIIDEQDAAGVYYLPLLTDISGWTYSKNKNGRWKRITFADGRTLEVSEQEAEVAKEMLSYASNRLCAQKETGGNRSNINNMPGTEETWNPVINPAKTTYQKLVKVFMCMLIILFMMSYQILK